MDNRTVNAFYNENYDNFISCLTKDKEINYKMKRAKGWFTIS